MPLHLIKLCVGVESIAELEAHVAARETGSTTHTTRMVPKRLDELLDGGSLFWVIRGQLCARQAFVDVVPFTDPAGIGRCALVLDPVVVPVLPRPYRAFQGWRYLDADGAPPDLAGGLAGAAAMPEHLRHALRELCLL